MTVETTQTRYPGRRWGRFVLGLGLVAVVSGCGSPTAIIDPNFSRVSFGYLNSGMAELGRLYLLDTRERSIYEVGAVPISAAKTSAEADYDAKQVWDFGVTLTGADKSSITKAEVAGAVQSQATFRIGRYFDASYSALDDDITAALRAQVAKVAAGGGSGWEIEAVLNDPDLVYLLVVRAYSAEEATFTLGNARTAGATVGIVKVGTVDVDVRIAGNAETRWRGTARPAVIEFIAFRPRIETAADGTQHIRFRRYGVKVPEDLSEILRHGPR